VSGAADPGSPPRTTNVFMRFNRDGRLYFEASGERVAEASRALLISYHFPPDPVVGSLRWQEMIRHFADHGWIVDVLTRDFTRVRGVDLGRLSRLPAGTRVYSVRDHEPLVSRLQKLLWPWVRPLIARPNAKTDAAAPLVGFAEREGTPFAIKEYLAWMDVARDRNWARAAARAALKVARAERYGVIITSGPPHMAHIAGAQVARDTGIPLVVDMRDPWSMIERLSQAPLSPTWLRLARKYEARAVASATLVTMNTEAAAVAMRSRYPAFANRVEVIRNGSDDEPIPAVAADDVFRVRFAGSIYLDRDPRLFFRAAGRVIRDLNLTPQQIAIEFVGEVDRFAGIPTLDIAVQEGVAGYLSVGAPLPRGEVLRFLAGATMLLSLPQDSHFGIPAKIYEYAKMPAWLLVLAQHGSATAQLLDGSDASVLDPADVDGMAVLLRQRFEEFRRGVRPIAVGRDGRFDRSVQSAKLLELVTRHVASRVPTPRQG
jgi:hypothetical protein